MKKILAVVLLAVVSLVLLSCSKSVTGPAGASGLAGSVSVAFRQGFSPTTGFGGATDTFLYDYYATSNYGSDASGSVGYYTGFEHMALQFLIDGYLPANAIVTGAYLTMHCNNVYNSGNVIAYSLDQALYEGTDTWNTVGPMSGPVSGAVHVGSIGYYDFKLNNSMVQNWLDNVGASYGIILRSQTESGSQPDVIFDSNNNVNIVYRPMLTVYYYIQ